jgi:protein-glutamine gamma-glutamyltransferase
VSFYHQSPEVLEFERGMRAGIMAAARALNVSGADFAAFEESRCNMQIWHRARNGGFQLRRDVPPSVAIIDFYRNGHLYAYECAAAMVIVLYKATLDTIGERAFNTHFRDIFIRNWNLHSNMKVITTYFKNGMPPGDIVYFRNPDYSPDNVEWQGENAVMLAENLYYAHGIGIATSAQIIEHLNQERIPGSRRSAFLTNQALHPDFEYLRRLSLSRSEPGVDQRHSEIAIRARIGAASYTHNY